MMHHYGSRSRIRETLLRAVRMIRGQGPIAFLRLVATRLRNEMFYNAWIMENASRRSARGFLDTLAYKPKVSIVMPVFETDERILVEAIESVRNQSFDNWELCICDNGSSRAGVARILREMSQRDKRIRVTSLPVNKGISAGSNAALALVDGEFTGFLDHDDVLYPDALLEVVRLLNEEKELDYIYSDEDKINTNGKRTDPFFKPDWSPDLFLSVNYLNHFSVYRTTLLRSIGGLRDGYEGSQDYDLTLRATEKTTRIGHIKKPLYGWRVSSTSTAGYESAKPRAYVSAVKALRDAMVRRGIEAQVEMLPIRRYRVRYAIKGNPLITIIIPARNHVHLENCIRSILNRTQYDQYEIIVACKKPGDLSWMPVSPRINVVSDSSFATSQTYNKIADTAHGQYLVFLHDDTQVVSEEWLSAMLEHSQREEVGAVGAKLLYTHGTVQHAGIVVGENCFETNCGAVSATDPGYFAFADVIRNCAAVSSACMMVRKTYFEELGGFHESLCEPWNDADFGIRVLQNGRRVVWTPFALLYHRFVARERAHGAGRPEIEARRLFAEKNRKFIQCGDPFYNPNLSVEFPYAPKCNPSRSALLRIASVLSSKLLI